MMSIGDEVLASKAHNLLLQLTAAFIKQRTSTSKPTRRWKDKS